MSDSEDLSFSEMRDKRNRELPARPAALSADVARPAPRTPASPTTDLPPAGKKSTWHSDSNRVLLALKQRWRTLLKTAAITALIGLVAGYLLSSYAIKVTFILQNPDTALVSKPETDAAKPRSLTAQTLVKLMESPELMRRVAVQTNPRISSASVKARISVRQEREVDLVSAVITGQKAQRLVDLATNYAAEATKLGKELQTAETRQMNRFYQESLATTDSEIASANADLVRFQRDAQVLDPESEAQTYMKQYTALLTKADNARIDSETMKMQITALKTELARQNPIAQKLDEAKTKLAELLGQFTEEHPSVQRQRREIAALEKQLKTSDDSELPAASSTGSSMAGALYLRLVELEAKQATLARESKEFDQLKADLQNKVTNLSEKGVHYALIKAWLDALRSTRGLLANRQREAQLYAENAQGYFRVFATPSLKDINLSARWMKSLSAGVIGFLAGVFLCGLAVAARALADDRLRTVSDVERTTHLPVLATLGNLDEMSAIEREHWAFRTWTALSGQLNSSPNCGLVCGFTSSSHGEGRSTWINLLAKAATQRGLHVLAIGARPNSYHPDGSSNPGRSSQNTVETDRFVAGSQLELQLPVALKAPEAVTQQLVRSDGPPVAYLPLAGSPWDREWRQQWQEALTQWRRQDNLVLLVELPPASAPEAVLLAEDLPQVIWLVDSGKSRKQQAKLQLETLRHAKCRLACAVLNHQPEDVFKS